MRTGVIARKIGMSRIFKEDGSNIPITILKMENCRVVDRKTKSIHGYNALCLSFGKKSKNINKPIKGFFKKKKIDPSLLVKEFRVSENGMIDEGTEIKCDHFITGQKVDVTGFTIGKGFAGGMKRHNFSGNRATHGVSISHRSHGSTGQCQDPGKVFKGKKMAGRLGNVKRTMQNLEVVGTDNKDELILLKGSVPGPKGLVVTVSDATKLNQKLQYPTSENALKDNINSSSNQNQAPDNNQKLESKQNNELRADSNIEATKNIKVENSSENKTQEKGEQK